MSDYYHNENICCSKCNRLRYMGYTDESGSELCICSDQDNIPIVIKYNTFTAELTDEELLYASEEDWAFYNKIIEGLPTMAGKNNDGLDKFGVPIPYHSGPHILRHFRDTIEIVKPKRIFEIGFNMGHSATMWLSLFSGSVISCDVSQKDETFHGANTVWYRFKDRFIFEWREDITGEWIDGLKNTYLLPFDLAFIDGAHDDENITNDILLCKKLNIPYLLFDDWYERFGATKVSVAKFPELELVKDMNNLRLYKVNYGC